MHQITIDAVESKLLQIKFLNDFEYDLLDASVTLYILLFMLWLRDKSKSCETNIFYIPLFHFS